MAEQEYTRFAARRRSALEAQREADLLELLDVELKKMANPNPVKRWPPGERPAKPASGRPVKLRFVRYSFIGACYVKPAKRISQGRYGHCGEQDGKGEGERV